MFFSFPSVLCLPSFVSLYCSRLQETTITMLTNGNNQNGCNNVMGGNGSGMTCSTENCRHDDTIDVALTSDYCQQHQHTHQLMWEYVKQQQPHHTHSKSLYRQQQHHHPHHHHQALMQGGGKRHNMAVNDNSAAEEYQYDCYEMATMSNGQHRSLRRKSFAALHCFKPTPTASSSSSATAASTSSTKPLFISCKYRAKGKCPEGDEIECGNGSGSGASHLNHCKCQSFINKKSQATKYQNSKTVRQQPETLYLTTMCEWVWSNYQVRVKVKF